MKLPPSKLCSRRKAASGVTLIELIVSVAVSVIVIGSVVALSIITSQNFAGTSNYVQLDNQSRNAQDRISREIRNATVLVAFSTNNPQYLQLTNSIQGNGATITYDGSNTLKLAKTGQATLTLLTGCDSFGFQIFNRYPNPTNFSFYSSLNVAGQLDQRFCKVINMSWKCSRSILGSKLNTEIAQGAQVVLRNQISQ